MNRTYITIANETIRLYSDGTIRAVTPGTPGNGRDVAPGESMRSRSRIDVASLSESDRATWERWDAEQREADRKAGL
jgi:hypothetical protein